MWTFKLCFVLYIACTSQILHHHPGFDTEVVSVLRCLTLSSIIINYTRNHSFLNSQSCECIQDHCTGNHHKSRYCDIVPGPLEKSRGLKMLVTQNYYCLPTNPNHLFNLIGFSISTKNKIFLLHERSSVIGSIWCLWNQSSGSPTFSSDFCQGIV